MKFSTLQTSVFLILSSVILFSCHKESAPIIGVDFRQEMRNLVIEISQTAKDKNPQFQVIPQNGLDLISSDGQSSGLLNAEYLAAIDGHGQEGLNYGYEENNQATSEQDREYLHSFLDRSKAENKSIFITDYCFAPSYIDEAYSQNEGAGYIGFAANQLELNEIPFYPLIIPHENNQDVTSLDKVKNFLYLINPGNFPSKESFIKALCNTNYDMIIMDAFYDQNIPFTAEDISRLKQKENGSKRMVIAYMSIGEAEDYRYYWKKDWKPKNLDWMEKENSNWAGNYKVQYWDTEWKQIMFGNSDSYLTKIQNAQFDGVYLDIIDAYEFFENN